MGYYLSVPFLALAAILQVTILPSFRLANAQPNLILLLVLGWAVHAEWEEAVWWAFLGGILADLLSIVPTGTSVVSLLVMVFIIRFISEQVFRFSALLLPVFAAVGTLLHHIVLLIVLAVTYSTYDLVEVVERFTLPGIVLNAALILPVYIVLRLIQRRIPAPQSAW